MKKVLVSVLVLLAMLTMFVGTVAAAPLDVKFLDAIWTRGGVKFIFEVDDDLTGGGWLKGNISWDGGGAGMTCNQEGDIVTCMGPKSAANKNITVSFQGFNFQTYVNSKPYCYNVYDWNYPGPYTEWVNWGQVCQDDAAEYGDLIDWYNPGWDFIYIYEFLPSSPTPCGFDPVNGDDYYYPGCPF